MQQIANPVSSRTSASLVASWASAAVSGSTATAPATFLQQLSLPAVFVQQYGAPADMWLNVTVTVDGEVQMNLQWFNKTSTRLGEAIFLQFATPLVPTSSWFIDVLGELVDPLDVVVRI